MYIYVASIAVHMRIIGWFRSKGGFDRTPLATGLVQSQTAFMCMCQFGFDRETTCLLHENNASWRVINHGF